MIGRTLRQFHIVAKIDDGGWGTVWRAEDSKLGRTVALKLLAEDLRTVTEARQRFLHEAQSSAALDHPGIAAVFEYGEADDIPFIAFALVDGETLSARVRRAPLTPGEVALIGIGAAEALAHAHSRGVIHRDVTGRNLMLTRDGRPVLIDFGLAVVAGHARLTTSKGALGTAPYMAPEIIQGDDADPRSDLYGLGAVMYEGLTGAPPFRGERIEAVLFAVLNQLPEPPSARRDGIPDWLERVVLRTLAKDPLERYQNADELILDLSAEGDPARAREGARSAEAGDDTRPEPATGRSSLAVLRFRDLDMGADPESKAAALADGMAEVVSASLAKLTGFKVIPPGAFPATAGDAASRLRSARALGATLILDGALRRSGPRLRLTYSLLDSRRGNQIAADTLDGDVSDLFGLEDRLVESLLGALDPGGRSRTTRPPRSHDRAAHERYLQALGYLQRYENEASVDGAIALLERLIENEGGTPSLQAALGRAYLHKYRLTSRLEWERRASDACRRALALDPRAPEVLVTLGEVHTATGRYDEAIRTFRQALELRKDYAEALIGQAIALEGRGEFGEAEVACRAAIALRPEFWRGYNCLGIIFFKQGQFARAVEPWRRVIRLSPDNARGWYNLGAADFYLDRFEDAVRAYQRSIDILPTARAWTGRGTVLHYMGRFDEAAASHQRAADLTPEEPFVWGNLGSALRMLPGRQGDGETAFRRAVDLMAGRLAHNPNDAYEWAALATWRAELGMRTEALEATERALALGPRHVPALAEVGVAYFLVGDRTNALRWLEEAVRLGYGTKRLLQDPELAELRTDPEFQRIVAKQPGNLPPSEISSSPDRKPSDRV